MQQSKLSKDQIEMDFLLMALEDSDYSNEHYLDSETWKVIPYWSSLEELPWISEEDLKKDKKYIQIDPIPSYEGYKIMEDFIWKIENEKIRNHLSEIISKKKPFYNFKEAIFNYPEIREKWFEYHNNKIEEIALEWLRDNKILD